MKSKKRAIAIIVSVILVVETFLFSTAGATVVSNWGELVGLLFSRLTTPIVQALVAQFAGLIAYMEKASRMPGILKDFPVSDYQKALEDVYRESYWETVRQVERTVQTAEDWINLVEKGKTAPPVITGRNVVGDFSEYAGYVSGDVKTVYELLGSLENDGKIDEITKAHFLVKARELDAVKVALAQKVADDSASFAVLSKMVKDLENLYEKIDKTTASGSYSKEQAVKDLVKVQSLNVRMINEIVRRMVNQRATDVALVNYEINKSRDELINDLQVLHTKVEGSWVLK